MKRNEQDLFTKIKFYCVQVMSTVVFLAILYSAARYEVMTVLRDSSRNNVVASPQTR